MVQLLRGGPWRNQVFQEPALWAGDTQHPPPLDTGTWQLNSGQVRRGAAGMPTLAWAALGSLGRTRGVILDCSRLLDTAVPGQCPNNTAEATLANARAYTFVSRLRGDF